MQFEIVRKNITDFDKKEIPTSTFKPQPSNHGILFCVRNFFIYEELFVVVFFYT